MRKHRGLKSYINRLGTDDVIAVDQLEPNLTIQERGELNFCNERVTPYASEFAQYGYTNITNRCNELGGSGAILVTNRYYFHKDNLGSIVGITDNSGTTVTTYNYDSYGNVSTNGIDIGNERLFTGREYDSETGLYYNRARYYNPKLGRFISQDPIGQVDDVNLYAYVGNNPVNAVDLSGLEKILIMYSDEHRWNTMSFSKFSENLQKKILLQKLLGKKISVNVVNVKDFDDFKGGLQDFNEDNIYHKGEIYYIGHNESWLSANITNNNIGQLPKIQGEVGMTLYACNTQINPQEGYISHSNQIAQKLSNQLEIPVTGTNDYFYVTNNNQDFTTKGDWVTSFPGGNIRKETSFQNKFIHGIVGAIESLREGIPHF